jgi:type IV pilus assembly protein PilE
MSAIRQVGVTVTQILTALIALLVIIAVAIPLSRSHDLRTRRADAIAALDALQAAQDRYFGQHARYADDAVLHGAPPGGLGLGRKSPLGFYEIELRRSADTLGYVALAKVIRSADGPGDPRCAELRLDQLGRRSAVNDEGADTSADCWNEL